MTCANFERHGPSVRTPRRVVFPCSSRFSNTASANEWLARNPARLVKNPRGRDANEKRAEQKLPFTDDELKRIYDACPKYGYSPKYAWNGDDLADFISLSIYTGLRISDVAPIPGRPHEQERRDPGQNGRKPAHTFTRGCLNGSRIAFAHEQKSMGPHIFGRHSSKSLDVITDVWRRKLKRLWRYAVRGK